MLQILHSKILGKGTPLLILHGFLGSGDNWISLGRKFAKHFEVHLVDLRNHGRSFHDDEMDFEVMAEDIIAYCGFYKLDKITIIGHSMGGKVAMFLATQQQVAIQKLIVADIAPKAYNRGHDFILEALHKVDFSKHKTRSDIAKVLSQYIDKENIIQFLLKNIYRKNTDEWRFRFNLEVLINDYENIITALPTNSQFEGETLFLKGEYSNYITGFDTALIEAHFPNVKIITIPKSGHWLHAENPDEFYKEVILALE